MEITLGTELEPTADDPHRNWQRKNRVARTVLLQIMEPSCHYLVPYHQDAYQIWRNLEDMFDRKNVTSNFHSLNQLLSLGKDPATTIQDHIQEFELHFNRLESRIKESSDSSKAYERGLKLLLSDSEAKAHLLLRTLPDTFTHVVQNLQSKQGLTYNDARSELLDLKTVQDHSNHSNKALYGGHSKPNKPKRNFGKHKNNNNHKKSSSFPTPANDNECSFCKKFGRTYKGHSHKNCTILAGVKSSGQQGPSAARNNGHAHVTSNSQDDFSDNGLAFLAKHSYLSPSLPSSGIALKAARDKAYHVWYLDTGASHHLTSDYSILQNPVPNVTRIHIGSGETLDSTHSGTVKLNVDVGGGEVSNMSLSNVLYIPSWKEGSLISWSQLDKSGKVQMYGSDNQIRISLKNNNKTVLVAYIDHGLPQVPVLVKHGMGYISAVQYWHEALGHTSAKKNFAPGAWAMRPGDLASLARAHGARCTMLQRESPYVATRILSNISPPNDIMARPELLSVYQRPHVYYLSISYLQIS